MKNFKEFILKSLFKKHFSLYDFVFVVIVLTIDNTWLCWTTVLVWQASLWILECFGIGYKEGEDEH